MKLTNRSRLIFSYSPHIRLVHFLRLITPIVDVQKNFSTYFIYTSVCSIICSGRSSLQKSCRRIMELAVWVREPRNLCRSLSFAVRKASRMCIWKSLRVGFSKCRLLDTASEKEMQETQSLIRHIKILTKKYKKIYLTIYCHNKTRIIQRSLVSFAIPPGKWRHKWIY